MSFFLNLSYTLAQSFLLEVGERSQVEVRRAAECIYTTHASLNPFVKTGITVLALYFVSASIVRYAHVFQRLSPHRQQRHIAAWHHSSFSIKRDFIQFFRNLTLQAYFDSDVSLSKRAIDVPRYRSIERLYNLGTSYD